MFRRFTAKIAQKIPRIPRWGLRGIALFSAVFVIMLSCVTASAGTVVDHTFYCSKPQISDKSGFIELVRADGKAFCIYVSAYSQSSEGTLDRLSFSANVLNGQLRIYNSNNGTSTSDLILWGVYWDNYGRMESLGTGSAVTIWLGGSSVVTGIHGYNVNVSSVPVVDSTSGFVFNYGTDVFVVNKLNSIIDNLATANTRFEDINGKLSSILSGIQSQGDKNTNEIKKNNDDNTQKIIDNQNELQQKEKDETQAAGDKSASDTESAVPSVNEGFGTSLKSFVQSMSYNGTEALLPIPRLYIPAMSNVTDEITLMNEQNYDMSAAINQYLPDTLLKLIRHLFTIALILYCVYELYGLIQYVLTLRKGGKEE